MDNGVVVAIYQGARGARPDLDFIVKYKQPGKRLRAPSHTHWIVDLLIKSEYHSQLVCKYVSEWIDLYDKMEPFETVEERNGYTLIHNQTHTKKYGELNGEGGYTVDVLSAFIELFIRCEKQTPGAFMFKNLLILMQQYCQGKKDFYQVVGHSKRV
jgi:hypothetical protein